MLLCTSGEKFDNSRKVFKKKSLRLATKEVRNMLPPIMIAGFALLVMFWSGFEVNFYVDADGSRSFRITFGSRSKRRMI